MQSTITSKFQTTIPKAIREHLGVSVKDTLEWRLENGTITVYPARQNFLKHRNAVKTGVGDIAADIDISRNLHADKYR